MEATWLPKRYGRDMDESETGCMLSQVTVALEDSVNSFTQHVAKDIFKRHSLAEKLEHLAKTDMSRYRRTAYGQGINLPSIKLHGSRYVRHSNRTR